MTVSYLPLVEKINYPKLNDFSAENKFHNSPRTKAKPE